MHTVTTLLSQSACNVVYSTGHVLKEQMMPCRPITVQAIIQRDQALPVYQQRQFRRSCSQRSGATANHLLEAYRTMLSWKLTGQSALRERGWRMKQFVQGMDKHVVQLRM